MCLRLSSVGSRALAAGVTWTLVIANALWGARAMHTSVVDAAGAIYVIGGVGGIGSTNFRDVWVSTDGGAQRLRQWGGRGGYTRGVLQGYYRGLMVQHGGTAGVLGGTRGTPLVPPLVPLSTSLVPLSTFLVPPSYFLSILVEHYGTP